MSYQPDLYSRPPVIQIYFPAPLRPLPVPPRKGNGVGVWAHSGSLWFRPSGPVRNVWLIGCHGPVLNTVCSVLPYQVTIITRFSGIVSTKFDPNESQFETKNEEKKPTKRTVRRGFGWGQVLARFCSDTLKYQLGAKWSTRAVLLYKYQ